MMTIENIRIVIRLMQILIPVFAFVFVMIVAESYHPGKHIVKTYERVNRQLKEVKNGVWDYENTERFLRANGAEYRYGKKLNPIRFLLIRLLLAVLLFAGGIPLHWSVAVLFAFLGFRLPVLWLENRNRKDNAKMLMQIKNLYSSLVIQIQAGGTVTHVLGGMYGKLPKGRIRKALEELNTELFMTKDFGSALEHFNGKFNSPAINSLCTILNQAQESGRAVDLLTDMSEEIRGMKDLQNKKHRVRFKRRIVYGYLGIIAGILWVMIYSCITDIYNMLLTI